MSIKYFHPKTVDTFRKLHQSFETVETLQGEEYVLKFRMLDGEVFVHHMITAEGSTYNVQWIGKPESFGFILKPQSELWGPYHFM